MICQRCLHRASALAHLPKTSIPASTSQLRPLTNHPTSQRPPFSRTLTTTTPTPASSPPSTSTAVEFASPLTPILPPSTRTATSKAPTTPTSSVPAGNALRGLNYLKSGSEPVALEDDAYPAWLWRCLDDAGKKRGGGDGGDGGGGGQDGLDADLFSKSKKQRRIAAKKLRKFAESNPESLVPKVPVQEQSRDLWAGDGSLAGAVRAEEGRREVTRALRGVRRRGIKEENFLKGMR